VGSRSLRGGSKEVFSRREEGDNARVWVRREVGTHRAAELPLHQPPLSAEGKLRLAAASSGQGAGGREHRSRGCRLVPCTRLPVQLPSGSCKWEEGNEKGTGYFFFSLSLCSGLGLGLRSWRRCLAQQLAGICTARICFRAWGLCPAEPRGGIPSTPGFQQHPCSASSAFAESFPAAAGATASSARGRDSPLCRGQERCWPSWGGWWSSSKGTFPHIWRAAG